MDKLYEYMEIDESEIPNLPSLKPTFPVKNEQITFAPDPSVGNHRSRGMSICLVKPEAIMLPQHSRHQQTNQPTRMPDEDLSPFVSDQLDNGACPPSTAGFDDIDCNVDEFCDMEATLPQALSEIEFETLKGTLQSAATVPSVPELDEFGGPHRAATIHLMVSTEVTLPPGIRLKPEHDAHDLSSPISASADSQCCERSQDDDQLIHQLMEEIPEDTLVEALDEKKSSEAVGASPCECKFDGTARRVLEIHSVIGMRIQHLHAKKKPMLHEFLGYLLFLRADHGLAMLRNAVCFCKENGDALPLVPLRPSDLFKVNNFEVVSAVWRRIKSNSSNDTIKNMKRAMRMSTSNERQYFLNLSHKQHRQQIFRFGERSVEFFRLAFPEHYRA